MTRLNEYHPDSVTHPGMDLAEKLEEIGMGPKEFAIRTAKPEKTISAILSGNSSITPEMAILFETVLKIPAGYWLNRQRHYDEHLVRTEIRKIVLASVPWAKKFPIGEMVRQNWLTTFETDEELVSEVLSFFEVATQKAWEDYFFEAKLPSIFNLSLREIPHSQTVAAWIRQGERKSEELEVGEFSKSAFLEATHELQSKIPTWETVQLRFLQDLCATAGVKLVVTEKLPKNNVIAVSRWFQDAPLLQLSSEFEDTATFYTTFFHLCGHVIYHGKKDVFLEGVIYNGMDQEKEDKASAFSEQCLLTHRSIEVSKAMKPQSEDEILEASAALDVNPAMLVSRLKPAYRKKFEDRFNAPLKLA